MSALQYRAASRSIFFNALTRQQTGDTTVKLKLLSLLVTLAAAQVGAQVTNDMITKDAATTNDVLSWGLGTQGQRYSPLTDVNAKSISKLVPVWSMSFGGEKQRGQQSQPLIHGGKMFVTASYSRIFALDAKTGKKLWKYEHRLPEGIMPCCDVINRGAALYDNLVIFGTLDAQLVALDQNTGKVVWREKIDDYAAGYSYTAAPLIAEGLLLTGVSGGEFGVVGRVEARDPKTGKMVWSRPTVEGHMGYKDGKENGISAPPTPPGLVTPGKPVAPPLGWAARTTLKPVWLTSAPATPALGTATCVKATTFTPPPPWPSMSKPARSLGATKTPPTTVGTSTV